MLAKTIKWLGVVAILGLMLAAPMMAVAAQTEPPTISTDQLDYAPGSLVTLTGQNWAPGETVHILVTNNSGDPWYLESGVYPESDPVAYDGTFTFSFTLPSWFIASYTVTASGSSGEVATTTFTDSAIGTYDQCANDEGTGYPTNNCNWINGNLNANNSAYTEGDATVQRLWLTGLTAGPHTITFNYQTTKSGKHAYDYLTNWDYSEDYMSNDNLCAAPQGSGTITGCTGTAGADTYAIPDDPNPAFTSGQKVNPVPQPAGRYFMMNGGDITDISTPAIASGTYSGDSLTAVTVTFNAPASGPMCVTKSGTTTCGVILWFGAHVARTDQWTSGGAGTVPGSPYHVILAALDGDSIGSRDNQMQSNAIVQDLTISKTVTATLNRTYNWTIEKSVDKTEIDIAQGGSATFNYTIDVTPVDFTDSGWAVSGVITVSNPNTKTSMVANVTDTIDNGGTCTVVGGTSVTVPKATIEWISHKDDIFNIVPGVVTLDYTCSYPETGPTDDSGTNTATVTWDQSTYHTPDASASFDAPFSFSTLNETDRTITVVDNKATGTNINLGTSDFYTGPFEFKYSLTKSGVAGTCVDYTNTASIVETGAYDSQTVIVCVGKDLTVTKTAVPSFTRTYGWDIDKTADKTEIDIADGGSATFNYTVSVAHNAGADSLWKVDGIITVTNPNTWEDIVLTDVTDAVGSTDCTVTKPSDMTVPENNGTLQMPYSCTFAEKPDYETDLTNSATATWDKTTYFTTSGSANGTKTFQFTDPTSIKDGSITVVDDKTNPGNPVTLGTAEYTQTNPIQFTYSLNKPGVAGTCTDYTNTASFTTSDLELTDNATETVTVCVGKDLVVSKTVTPTFTRTYAWTIAKAVDKTKVDVSGNPPQNATFNYTVTVTHDAGTDSAWALSGSITIENPNDWEAIVLDDVTDVAGSTACTVSKPADMTVPARVDEVNGKLSMSYSCTMPNGTSGTNTATATWVAATYYTPTGTSSGTKDFAFTTPTTIVDGSVNITDTQYGAVGSMTYNDASPKDFKYSKSYAGVAGTCTTYNNTATFTTNTTASTGSDSKSVQVCATVLKVLKLTNGAIDPSQSWNFVLKDSGGSTLASDTASGKADGLLTFGGYFLDPTKSYTLCETNAPAGWASIWYFDMNGDGSFDPATEIITPVNPDLPIDIGNRCVDFGAGTAYTIPSGGTVRFEVDNRYPGGEPRTIGFWKNWSSCTGGNQVETAAKNGGPAAGWFILDNLLPQTIGELTIDTCEVGVQILSSKDIDSGKNKASDGAYNLAAQLLAAQLNGSAGAKTCPAQTTAVAQAQKLLTDLGFTGTGDYLPSKVKGALLDLRNQALSLASTLELYNSGQLCP